MTKYRRERYSSTRYSPSAKHTIHAVCTDLYVESVEFNGEVDHVHPLVHYPPTLAISALLHRLKGRTA